MYICTYMKVTRMRMSVHMSVIMSTHVYTISTHAHAHTLIYFAHNTRSLELTSLGSHYAHK